MSTRRRTTKVETARGTSSKPLPDIAAGPPVPPPPAPAPGVPEDAPAAKGGYKRVEAPLDMALVWRRYWLDRWQPSEIAREQGRKPAVMAKVIATRGWRREDAHLDPKTYAAAMTRAWTRMHLDKTGKPIRGAWPMIGQAGTPQPPGMGAAPPRGGRKSKVGNGIFRADGKGEGVRPNADPPQFGMSPEAPQGLSEAQLLARVSDEFHQEWNSPEQNKASADAALSAAYAYDQWPVVPERGPLDDKDAQAAFNTALATQQAALWDQAQVAMMEAYKRHVMTMRGLAQDHERLSTGLLNADQVLQGVETLKAIQRADVLMLRETCRTLMLSLNVTLMPMEAKSKALLAITKALADAIALEKEVFSMRYEAPRGAPAAGWLQQTSGAALVPNAAAPSQTGVMPGFGGPGG